MAQIPSDNQIRNLLDPLPPEHLFPVFGTCWQILKATGILTTFQTLDQQYLIALDGTQYFSSQSVHCDTCSHTTSASGVTTYSHMGPLPMLVAPHQPHALVLAPEFITPQDGHDKQDCEHAAAKRWLVQHASAFSPQSVTLLGDDLYSHQPFCELALTQQFNFILVCKPDSQLFAPAQIDPAVNPQLTDDAGHFGWNVVMGCWYIVVSAPSHASKVSPLVGVSPEVTDLTMTLEPFDLPNKVYLPLVRR